MYYRIMTKKTKQRKYTFGIYFLRFKLLPFPPIFIRMKCEDLELKSKSINNFFFLNPNKHSFNINKPSRRRKRQRRKSRGRKLRRKRRERRFVLAFGFSVVVDARSAWDLCLFL